MSRIHRPSIPIVLAVLVAVLVGPSLATAATEVTERVMIPASAFTPTTDDHDYNNQGHSLKSVSGISYFGAPLTFPAQKVRLKRIALYAYDNNASGSVCVYLYRAEPSQGGETYQAGICTNDSADDPQAISTGTSFPRFANTGMQAPYLWLKITTPGKFYGVAVTYTYTP